MPAIEYGPGGAGEPPWPRCSYRSRRNFAPSAASCGCHSSEVVPSELPRTRTGAPAAPSRLAASRTGAGRSDIEEDGLVLTLEVDVEAQPARARGIGSRHQ